MVGTAAGSVFALYLVNMPLIQFAAMLGGSAFGARPAFALWLLSSFVCAYLLTAATARLGLARR